MSYSLWGFKELDTTEELSLHTHRLHTCSQPRTYHVDMTNENNGSSEVCEVSNLITIHIYSILYCTIYYTILYLTKFQTKQSTIFL